MEQNQINSLWCLIEDKYDVRNNRRYEGMFAQGNGYVSTRGVFEEGAEDSSKDEEYIDKAGFVTTQALKETKFKCGTYVPGITGHHPHLNEEIINLPWFLEFKVWFDGECLDMEKCSINDYKRWLDFRDGTLNREFIWNTKSGGQVKMEYRRFLDINTKNLSSQEINIKVVKGSGELYIESGIDGNVKTNGYNHFSELKCLNIENRYIGVEVDTDNQNKICEISYIRSEKEFKWNIEKRDKHILYTSRKDVQEGNEFIIRKYTAITTDRDLDTCNISPLDRAVNVINNVEKEDSEKIYEEHAKIWKEKWENSDIIIEGDDKSQLAVRFSIYHLIRSCIEDDSRVSICAKGYAGEGYYGRYFWDTEIYMLPFYIYTNPKAARNLIKFRYNTLEGAKENAKRYGYKGARYPWESSIKGDEQCPLWQFADNEVHITADIVFALWNYYSATNDYEYMINYGIELMVETSRYWVTRVDKNKNGGYDLLGVMGPDEYTPFTKNNAYTNRMVKFSLDNTVEFINVLRGTNKEKFNEIRKKLNLIDEEIELFKEVSSKLIIPYDKERKLVLQSEDFESFADIDLDEIWTDRNRYFVQFISQEKLYRSKCIKQADVLTLMMLFPQEFTNEEIKNSYEYYEPITTHDSSLSPAAHAFIAARLGKEEEAVTFFNKAVHIDLSLNTDGASEGIHIANSGALWQLIVHGFAGVKSSILEDKLKLEPKIPKHWNKLCFSIIWKNKKYKITIDKDGSYHINKK